MLKSRCKLSRHKKTEKCKAGRSDRERTETEVEVGSKILRQYGNVVTSTPILNINRHIHDVQYSLTKGGYKNNDNNSMNDNDSTATPNFNNNITPDVTWDLLPECEYVSDDIENSAEFSSASSENLYLNELTSIPLKNNSMRIRYYFIIFFRTSLFFVRPSVCPVVCLSFLIQFCMHISS